MPEPHAKEFSDAVVAIAGRGEIPASQISKRFGMSDSCLRNWLQATDVQDGKRPGVAASESAELHGVKKRNRLLEQENEVLCRAAAYFARAHLPER